VIVNRLGQWLAVAAAIVLMANAGPALAQDISDAADLTAVIALNGQPCGKVVSAAKRADNDYVATCEDGNRYRVYVRDGRVIVEKTS
jgi:hypothetical protein